MPLGLSMHGFGIQNVGFVCVLLPFLPNWQMFKEAAMLGAGGGRELVLNTFKTNYPPQALYFNSTCDYFYILCFKGRARGRTEK